MKAYSLLYNKGNVVTVDVNENNVTVVVFKDDVLVEVFGIESDLDRIVIAYAVRRKRVARGRSTKIREVKKKLRKLREKDRKHDIILKIINLIEQLAKENNAVVVVGDIDGKDKKKMIKDKDRRLRHRIHQMGCSNSNKTFRG